jgi:serine O-acetyltransferase
LQCMIRMPTPERLVRGLRHRRAGHYAELLLRIYGLSIPQSVSIGRNLQLPHGAVGLVVHERTVIGDDVKLYQGVTIGRADTYLDLEDTPPGGCVRVGDRAIIGAGAVVLFRAGQTLNIGSDAVIGANSVVLTNVPDGQIWAGNPARCVGTRSNVSRRGPATSKGRIGSSVHR